MIVSLKGYLKNVDDRSIVEIFDSAGGLLYNGPAGSFNKDVNDIFVSRALSIGNTIRIITKHKEDM